MVLSIGYNLDCEKVNIVLTVPQQDYIFGNLDILDDINYSQFK